MAADSAQGSAPAPSSIVFELCGRTDVGMVRENNQDSLAAANLDSGERLPVGVVHTVRAVPRGPLMVVCDGMGGAAGGEVASSLAVEQLVQEMCDSAASTDRAELGRHLRRAVRGANQRVFERGARDWRLKGMGTTLSAVALVGEELLVAQVGDSRAYILRGGSLVQITRDQSVVSALLHAGRISEREAADFAQANIILQALGVREDVEVALSLAELRRGDRILLCSDGLHGLISDDEIAEIMAEQNEPAAAVDALIARANAAGGNDNITAMVARIDGDGLRAPDGPDDLPRFTEFDPREDPERALTTTSRVARRLAVRAGMRDDEAPHPIPATGQHRAIRLQAEGPADSALAERQRLGLAIWLLAVALVAAIAFLVLWGVV